MQQVLFSKLDEMDLWFRKLGCKYFIVDTREKLERLRELALKSDVIGFDVETTGLDVSESKLVGASIALREGLSFYVPFGHLFSKNIEFSLFRDLFKDILETKNIIGHNIKFDYVFLKAKAGIHVNCTDDTFIIARMLEEFDSCALKYLGATVYGFDVLELTDLMSDFGITYADLDSLKSEEMYEYCCQDTDLTIRLYNTFYKEYKWKRIQIYEEEVKLIKTLGDMELRGVKVDYDILKKFRDDYQEEINVHGKKMREILGVNDRFNLESNVQFITAYLRVNPKFKKHLIKLEKSGVYKMNKDSVFIYRGRLRRVLEEEGRDPDENIFAHHIEWKQKVSLISKYLDPWIEMVEGNKSTTIRTNYLSIGADTGRMSSRDPNLQNVTPKIRHAIVPRDGYYFLSMDYDQVEYRIFAAMANLPHLIEEINKDGADVHTIAARLLYNIPDDQEVPKDMRSFAKTLNFGLLYGMGLSKLAANLGITIDEAKDLKNKYRQRFLRNTKWFNRVKMFAAEHGYVLTSFGRKRRIENADLVLDRFGDKEEQDEIKRLLAEAQRRAINTPVQGTSADITKIGLNNVAEYIHASGLDVWPVLVIHDEIVFEVNEKYTPDEIFAQFKPCMEMMFKDKVKLTVDKNFSTISWGDMKG